MIRDYLTRKQWYVVLVLVLMQIPSYPGPETPTGPYAAAGALISMVLASIIFVKLMSYPYAVLDRFLTRAGGRVMDTVADGVHELGRASKKQN